MTSHRIPPPSSPDKPSPFERLHDAWRYAQAEWHLAVFNPVDAPPIDDTEEDACFLRAMAALDSLLLCPVRTVGELACKLRIIQEEQVMNGWRTAPEVFARLVADAGRLVAREE